MGLVYLLFCIDLFAIYVRDEKKTNLEINWVIDFWISMAWVRAFLLAK